MGLKQVLVGTLAAGMLSLGVGGTAIAVPVSLDFSGTLEDGGSASGWFTYDNSSPNRGTEDIATFSLTSWEIDVSPGTVGIPQHTFRNVPRGIGRLRHFISAGRNFTTVELSHRNFVIFQYKVLLLGFSPILDSTPTINPPSGIQEFGEFNPTVSDYGLYGGPFPGAGRVPIDVLTFQSGSLSASPIPEPSTLLLLGTGLAGLVVWRQKKRKTA